MAQTRSSRPDSQALAQQALALESQGDYPAAIITWKEAIGLSPNRADYHHTLGDVQRAARLIDDAIASYRTAAALQPDLAAAWSNLCSLLRMKGELHSAVESGRRAVDIEPKLAPAHNNLAIALLDLGETREALQHCQAALTVSPYSTPAHRTTSRALATAGETDLALTHARLAMQLQPDNAEIVIETADLLRDMSRLDEAATLYAQVSPRDPRHVDASIGIARVHMLKGDYESGWMIAGHAHAEHPDHLPAIMCVIELHQHFKRHEDAVAILQGQLDQPGWTGPQRRAMLFALGDSLDRLNRYNDAWQAYSEGNSLKPGTFDRSAFAAHVANLKRAFSPVRLGLASTNSHTCIRPIFIAGMPRSGTTLVEQIFASHPQVKGVGEFGLMTRVIGRIGPLTKSSLAYPESIVSFTEADIRTLRRFCLGELQKLSAACSHVVEKTPDNFLHIGLIRTIFPEAIIIHTRRHPFDTCLSCYFHDFVGHHPYAYRLDDLGWYHARQEELMHHWRNDCCVPILDVAYEDVVADLRGQTERLLRHADLPWNDRCLQFHQSRRAVHTASRDQVRKPIYSSSIGRWKRYEKHLQPLVESFGTRGAHPD